MKKCLRQRDMAEQAVWSTKRMRGYLTEASEIFKENHIKRIFDLVLRCSFSEIPVSEQEYRGYRRDMQNIRNAIEQKLGFWERLYFKYIRLF